MLAAPLSFVVEAEQYSAALLLSQPQTQLACSAPQGSPPQPAVSASAAAEDAEFVEVFSVPGQEQDGGHLTMPV